MMKDRFAGTRPGKAGNRKNATKDMTKGLTRRGLRRMFYTVAGVLGLALLVFLALFLTRPKFLWYVDADYSAAWNRILTENPPPFSRYEVLARSGDAPFPKGRFGFIVSRNGPEGERVEGAPVVLYRDISRTREYGGWMALALDPWMVFRKHQDPEPGRSFLNNRNERGSLLLAGVDQAAIHAWLCQVLQNKPGAFSQGSELWQEKSLNLVKDYPFQSAAFTYSWVQVWPLLFRSETAYLYAPLSQARALPPYRSGLLDATRFPEPENWDRYGMQADILWAKRQGGARGVRGARQAELLDSAGKWLADPQIQTLLANAIEWIPAHPSGTPYNTMSWETQRAWLQSSFIWQGADDVQDF